MKVPLAGVYQPEEQPQQPTQETEANLPQSGEVAVGFSSPPTGPDTPLTPAPPPPPPPASPIPFLHYLPFIAGGLIILVIFFFIFRFVAGNFGQQSKSSGNVTLTYWGLWEDDPVMSSVVSDFQKANPTIKINYQRFSLKQYRQTIQDRITQGNGPDVFRYHNTWVPEMASFLAPVTPNTYSNQEFEKTFYPVAVQNLKIGNNYYGVPLEIDTLALFINDDIFQAAGIAPPTTWNDLVKAAHTLTVVDPQTQRIQTSGIALGTFDNVDAASDIIALMMIQNGVDFKKISTSQSSDGRNLGEDVLSYYAKFAQGSNRVWDDTLPNSTTAFAQGKVGMYFGYSWRIFEIKQLNPNLKFHIIAAPQVDLANKKTFASYWVEGISNKSAHPKEAALFLRYLSQAETMKKLFAEEAKLRQFGEPYSRVDLADLGKQNPSISPFLELAPNAKSWYLASNTEDNGMVDQIRTYFRSAIGGIVQNNLSPSSALQTIAQGISKVETDFKIRLNDYGF